MAQHLNEAGSPPPGGDAGCRRPDLAELVEQWDELPVPRRDDLLAHAAVCPDCGPRLRLLRRSQQWLEAQAPPLSAGFAGPCPTAEELYDLAAGPGSGELPAEERAELEEHVASCEECRAFAATLTAMAPGPALLDARAARREESATAREEPAQAPAPRIPLPEADLIPAGAPPARPRSARPRPAIPPPLRGWLPLAAAATLILTGLTWRLLDTPGGPGTGLSPGDFPASAVLRGRSGDRLLFPRSFLLATPSDTGSARPTHDLLFEIAAEPDATAYRVTVRRHGGDAFTEGAVVGELAGPEPVLAASPELEAALSSGFYTWEAWAEIDGLDRYLGERDFELALPPPDLALELAELPREGKEAAGDLARVRVLHDAGFRGDARAVARGMPPSPGRDAYLELLPQR